VANAYPERENTAGDAFGAGASGLAVSEYGMAKNAKARCVNWTPGGTYSGMARHAKARIGTCNFSPKIHVPINDPKGV